MVLFGLLMLFGFGMFWGGYDHHSFGFFWPWLLLWFFWWFGGWRIFARVRSHRYERRALRRTHEEDGALATLRERFARGEIDQSEYEERRAILKGKAQAAPQPTPDGPEWPNLT